MINRLINSALILIGFIILQSSFTSLADEIKGREVCDKLKVCALAELDKQEMPDQMKQMVISELDKCASNFAKDEQAIIDAGLTDMANACADEVVEMPCERLMTPNPAQHSKACNDFEKASKEAGIEQ